MRIVFVVIYLFLLNVCSAQISDDFSDGDFTKNPSWNGNTESFIVDNSKRLRLNAGSTTSAILYTDIAFSNSFTLDITAKLEFNPSGSNFARIYFMADNTDLAKANAYYFLLGENGSDDAIRLFKQINGVSTLLASAKNAALNLDSSFFKINLTKLEKDFSIGLDYDLNGSIDDTFIASDNSIQNSTAKYFGIYCQFTSTRKDKFAFDDFIYKPIVGDFIPPFITKVEAIDSRSLQVVFNEKVDSKILNDLSAFSILNFGSPTSAVFSNANQNEISLKFDKDFSPNTLYNFEVKNVSDLSNNTAALLKSSFQFTISTKVGDLIITELLFDPYVNQQDFVEIYNNTSADIDLKGYKFKSFANGQEQTIESSIIIKSRSYMAFTPSITSVSNTYNPPVSSAIAMQVLPAMNNDKGNMSLLSLSGLVLDSFSYTDQLHTVDKIVKNIEGVSLEKLSLKAFENLYYHWASSTIENSYATPGYANSYNQDKTAPKIISIEVINDEQIVVIFDDVLNFESITNTNNYEINNGLGKPLMASFFNNKANQVLLTYDMPLDNNKDYLINIKEIKDKGGNTLSSVSLPILYGVKPIKGDLIISEILFNPPTETEDFVELYNASNKNISLQGLVISNQINQQSKTISNGTIKPNQYIAFTSKPIDTKNYFFAPDTANIILNSLPAFNADEGNVSISINGVVLDSFDYNEEFHNAFIDDDQRKGVSLEKILLTLSENKKNDWSSSAKSFNYATPGYKNSNVINKVDMSADFVITQKVFTPNQDGNQDFLIVEYTLPQSGFIANVKVFNIDGFLIKDLANNELLGTNGILKWDGYNDDGNLENIGIYILVGELFDADGNNKFFKKECVLGR